MFPVEDDAVIDEATRDEFAYGAMESDLDLDNQYNIEDDEEMRTLPSPRVFSFSGFQPTT